MPLTMLQGNKASQQAIAVKHITLSVKPGGHRLINLQANSPNSAPKMIGAELTGRRA
jgi:hypothetical protein